MQEQDARIIIARHRDAGRLAHAYLVVHPSTFVRDRVGKHVAQLLLCQGGKQDGELFCGSCSVCTNYEKNPEFFILRVQEEAGKRVIGVEAIRRVREYVYLSQALPFTIVLITHTETCTREAAAAMLKILEEPPPRTVFLLLAPDASGVSPILRSRVVTLRHLERETRAKDQQARQFFSAVLDERLGLAKDFSERIPDVDEWLTCLVLFLESDIQKQVKEHEALPQEQLQQYERQLRSACEAIHLFHTTNINTRLLLEQLSVSL